MKDTITHGGMSPTSLWGNMEEEERGAQERAELRGGHSALEALGAATVSAPTEPGPIK